MPSNFVARPKKEAVLASSRLPGLFNRSQTNMEAVNLNKCAFSQSIILGLFRPETPRSGFLDANLARCIQEQAV